MSLGIMAFRLWGRTDRMTRSPSNACHQNPSSSHNVSGTSHLEMTFVPRHERGDHGSQALRAH